jgi:hypothetical protein
MRTPTRSRPHADVTASIAPIRIGENSFDI